MLEGTEFDLPSLSEGDASEQTRAFLAWHSLTKFLNTHSPLQNNTSLNTFPPSRHHNLMTNIATDDTVRRDSQLLIACKLTDRPSFESQYGGRTSTWNSQGRPLSHNIFNHVHFPFLPTLTLSVRHANPSPALDRKRVRLHPAP